MAYWPCNFEFDESRKINPIIFNTQICIVIYNALMEGFNKTTGNPHLKKLIGTSREVECVFKGINTYTKHRRKLLSESMERQMECTTLMSTKDETKYFLLHSNID